MLNKNTPDHVKHLREAKGGKSQTCHGITSWYQGPLPLGGQPSIHSCVHRAFPRGGCATLGSPRPSRRTVKSSPAAGVRSTEKPHRQNPARLGAACDFLSGSSSRLGRRAPPPASPGSAVPSSPHLHRDREPPSVSPGRPEPRPQPSRPRSPPRPPPGPAAAAALGPATSPPPRGPVRPPVLPPAPPAPAPSLTRDRVRSVMSCSKARVSSACRCVCSAIFSLNFRGLALPEPGEAAMARAPRDRAQQTAGAGPRGSAHPLAPQAAQAAARSLSSGATRQRSRRGPRAQRAAGSAPRSAPSRRPRPRRPGARPPAVRSVLPAPSPAPRGSVRPPARRSSTEPTVPSPLTPHTYNPSAKLSRPRVWEPLGTTVLTAPASDGLWI